MPGNRYIGLPISFYGASAVVYNPALMEEYGLDADIFESYDLMYDAAVDLKKYWKGGKSNTEFRPDYNDMWLYFHNGGEIQTDFNNTLFREIMEGTLDIANKSAAGLYSEFGFLNKGSVLDCVFARTMPSEFYRSAKFETGYLDSHREIDKLTDDDVYAPLRAYDKFIVRPLPKNKGIEKSGNFVTSVAFLYVNPFSKNKEAAVKLLEYIAEAMLNPYYIEDLFDTSVVYDYYNLDEGEVDKQTLSWLHTFYVISGYPELLFKDMSVYNNVYNSGTDIFKSTIDFYSNGYTSKIPPDVEKYIDEYLSGNATLDDTITVIERYMRMYAAERE